jgi:hypothetical protein
LIGIIKILYYLRVDKEMNTLLLLRYKKQKETLTMDWKNNKYLEAIGIFWGASLFLGALVAVIIGFTRLNWIFAGITGGLSFLAFGLIIQGIITLLQKTEKI